jgi:hypothetical protein
MSHKRAKSIFRRKNPYLISSQQMTIYKNISFPQKYCDFT